MQTWGMPLLPRRFERLKAVLNGRMADLTVLLEHVEGIHHDREVQSGSQL